MDLFGQIAHRCHACRADCHQALLGIGATRLRRHNGITDSGQRRNLLGIGVEHLLNRGKLLGRSRVGFQTCIGRLRAANRLATGDRKCGGAERGNGQLAARL